MYFSFQECIVAFYFILAYHGFLKFFFFYFSRKASLALIRKMIHFCSEALLKEVCDSDVGHNLPTILVEITATVLDQEVSF